MSYKLIPFIRISITSFHVLLFCMPVHVHCASRNASRAIPAKSTKSKSIDQRSLRSIESIDSKDINSLSEDFMPKQSQRKKRRPYCEREEDRITYKMGGILYDAFDLHRNMFTSWTSYKIITGFFPLVLATRRADYKLHDCFYDRKHHKNISQVPEWCEVAAKTSISLPMVFFGLRALIGNESEEFMLTTRFLWVGLPFLIWSKEFIKKIQFDMCHRPWNENFDSRERAYGGFPSGHMAEAVYTATLYGLRFGLPYAIPTGALAWGIAVMFTVCNRHYLSQIVAGAGLGMLYAFAANKSIDSRLFDDSLDIDLSMNPRGDPTVSLSYIF